MTKFLKLSDMESKQLTKKMPPRAIMNMLQSDGKIENIKKDTENNIKNEITISGLKNKITKIKNLS